MNDILVDQQITRSHPLQLAYRSLRGADLRGFDLTGASLYHVDLSGANLSGCALSGGTWRHVTAVGADLGAVSAPDTFFEHCDFSRASLRDGEFAAAQFDQCGLRRASMANAALADAKLTACRADELDLTGADLLDAITVDTTFTDARFDGARRFATCREIVIEILRREIGTDLQKVKLLGAALLQRSWCYPEWQAILADDPASRELVLDVFTRFPASGVRQRIRPAAPSSASGLLSPAHIMSGAAEGT